MGPGTIFFFVFFYLTPLLQTPRGIEILRNFAIEICGAQPNWEMKDFIKKEIVRIRHLVGDRAQVIGAVSGGVDSTVAAKLMQEAIGKFSTFLFPIFSFVS